MPSPNHEWLPYDRGVKPLFVDIGQKNIERAVIFEPFPFIFGGGKA